MVVRTRHPGGWDGHVSTHCCQLNWTVSTQSHSVQCLLLVTFFCVLFEAVRWHCNQNAIWSNSHQFNDTCWHRICTWAYLLSFKRFLNDSVQTKFTFLILLLILGCVCDYNNYEILCDWPESIIQVFPKFNQSSYHISDVDNVKSFSITHNHVQNLR